MLSRRLTDLRRRLDTLRHPVPPASGPRWWTFGRKVTGHGDLSLPVLALLDRELDKVGVHTSADAQLLRELGARRGLAGALSQGLQSRAGQAL